MYYVAPHKLNHSLDFFYRTDRQKEAFYIYNAIKEERGGQASRIFSFLKVAIFLLLPVIMQIWVSSTSVVAVVVLCIDFPDEERRLPFFSISILPRSTSSTINGGRCAVGSLQYDIISDTTGLLPSSHQ